MLGLQPTTRVTSTAPRSILIGVVVLVAVGCAPDVVEVSALHPDEQTFVRDVYPIVLRDCGFPECHGSTQRFYQVFGPGRVRLGPAPPDVQAPDVLYPVQQQELIVTYERTRSMLTRISGQQDFLLLRKPLEVAAGGAGHLGTDRLGRNVYQSKQDPSWLALKAWADSSMAVAP
jgi:hypothetical protein